MVFFQNIPPSIPEMAPIKCPENDTCLLLREGYITMSIIDNRSIKSNFFVYTSSHAMIPNSIPLNLLNKEF